MDRYNLLNYSLYLVDLSSNIGNFFDNFLYFCINHNFLLSSNDINCLGLDYVLNYNFLKNSWDLNYFFNGFNHWYQLLNNSINWYWNFNWNNDLFFNLNNFGYLDLIIYYFLYWDFSRNFSNDFNNSLDNSLMRYNSLLYCFKLNEFIYYFLNDSVNLDIDVLLDDNLLNSSLNNWDLHNFLDLFDSFFYNDLRHNPFYYLNNFNYFFNNTWYHYNFLNYLFDLYNFWHLDHLFNNLLNWNFDLFDAVHMS